MKYEVHKDARKEFRELPEEVRELLKQEIESRKRREKNILNQRGSGISYDSHGKPVHYFKLEKEEEGIAYRVFFDISDGKVVLLGIRARNDDTYLNLREYSRMTE